MKKGQPRPRQWDARPAPGFAAERTIRTALLGIAKGLSGRISHKQRLEYLAHYQRLEDQLRTVVKQKLKDQLALIESSSQSEQQ